jgi:DNA repair protein RadC
MRRADMLPEAQIDGPRERLLSDGPRSLSGADLLALVLGTGSGALSARAAALGRAERVPLAELKVVQVAEGSLTQCPVSPRDALRPAVREGAHGLVFVHNHPSGVMWRSGPCGRPRTRSRRHAIRPAACSHDARRVEARP